LISSGVNKIRISKRELKEIYTASGKWVAASDLVSRISKRELKELL